MAGGATKKGTLITNINVTPLVDIMLVLLIVFMLTANLIARQAIEVELPQASAGAPTEPTLLAITLTREGDLFLEGEPTGGKGLRAAVKAAVARDDETQVVIAADKLVSHGRVMWIIDLVKTAGVASFAINIDPAALMAPDFENDDENEGEGDEG